MQDIRLSHSFFPDAIRAAADCPGHTIVASTEEEKRNDGNAAIGTGFFQSQVNPENKQNSVYPGPQRILPYPALFSKASVPEGSPMIGMLFTPAQERAVKTDGKHLFHLPDKVSSPHIPKEACLRRFSLLAKKMFLLYIS